MAKLDRKFCSRTCSSRWAGLTFKPLQSKVSKLCARCGIEFYRADKKVKFCSKACANARQADTRLPEAPCVHCSALFQPLRRTHVYCSKTCWYASKVVARSPKRAHHMRVSDRGGLPVPQFMLWRALGDDWYPEFWMSPLGALGEDVVRFQLDLAHLATRTAVEVDGSEHLLASHQAKDQIRDEWLRTQGWTVLRFSNAEVLSSIDSVVAQIRSRSMT